MKICGDNGDNGDNTVTKSVVVNTVIATNTQVYTHTHTRSNYTLYKTKLRKSDTTTNNTSQRRLFDVHYENLCRKKCCFAPTFNKINNL